MGLSIKMEVNNESPMNKYYVRYYFDTLTLNLYEGAGPGCIDRIELIKHLAFEKGNY